MISITVYKYINILFQIPFLIYVVYHDLFVDEKFDYDNNYVIVFISFVIIYEMLKIGKTYKIKVRKLAWFYASLVVFFYLIGFLIGFSEFAAWKVVWLVVSLVLLRLPVAWPEEDPSTTAPQPPLPASRQVLRRLRWFNGVMAGLLLGVLVGLSQSALGARLLLLLPLATGTLLHSVLWLLYLKWPPSPTRAELILRFALPFGVVALLFLGGMFWLILSPDSPYAQPPLQWVRPYDLIGSSVLFIVLNVLPVNGQLIYLLKRGTASAPADLS